MQSEFSGSLGAYSIVSYVEIHLYNYIEKVGSLEEVRKARYRLMAMLLDFEEKWENKFQCVVQAWAG